VRAKPLDDVVLGRIDPGAQRRPATYSHAAAARRRFAALDLVADMLSTISDVIA